MTALRPEREDLYDGERPYESPGGARPYGGRRQDPPTAPMPRLTEEGLTAPPPPGEDLTSALPRADEETMALRIPRPAGYGAQSDAARAGTGAAGASSAASATPVAPGGRAARRRAAKRRGGRHGGARDAREPAAPSADRDPQRPLSRVEARRQARLRKPSPATVASRAIGEVFITTGVLMLLFVTYQLWWTNVRAHAQAGSEAHQLQDDWANGKRNPGVFEPGQGFAILHIPKLDVVAPIAEGVSNKRVLDKGMVGHYGEAPLKTAMPDARTGNFGLAAHRNTHGEPFRYINRLKAGDAVVVETQDTYFVYKVTSMLPVTPPSNTSVLNPVPPGSGFTRPGRYITLTTCTPEFTSKYRLIVWGKMVQESPRSKGKPDALIE
ncbi:class E sortase [Streptomyces olivaceoviridis]|uniref:class E sortase n=1 Tax=Streptomyces olivaceoviridis TaxID=1921 RepID=UPI0016788CD9|nr:class E sortase [Streptomyces olivaceoviridis]GGZ10749.1 class E sortase [Streptomyces olivaceoviridis]